MAQKLAVSLGLICAVAVMAGGLYARYNFVPTLFAALAALVLGLVAGRILGVIAARASQPENKQP